MLGVIFVIAAFVLLILSVFLSAFIGTQLAVIGLAFMVFPVYLELRKANRREIQKP